jgi:hypothetical protein
MYIGSYEIRTHATYESDFEKNNINLVQAREPILVKNSWKKWFLLETMQTAYGFDKLIHSYTGLNSRKMVGLQRGAVIVGRWRYWISRNACSRDIVTFLVRETSLSVLPYESQMINRHILEHHIDLKLDTNLKDYFRW